MADEIAVTTSSRRIVPQLAIGAVLGFSAACFFGSGLIGWWWEPPSKGIISCADDVRAAITSFIKMQFTSAVIGAVVLTLAVHLVRRAFSKRRSGSSATT